ncbi:hypothetical protein Belba_3755 [Belliella baltica DSM 15883]|uniref:Outer membrane protein beta-barrel domain-containing protein n=1 Tax=Belliella baltica (strain DSM 15883 / CIP 108006 / LMG 21964 / BA134) TaxID=866536 RepID=I3ZAH0_BELBD|nr:hypothetical protein [Belliella baltica]AFL86238.1 hypothetical protein Belba_3755 [Belliella baltica DSM 15883]
MIKNYALFSLLFLLGLLICNVAQGQKEIPSKDILYLKDGTQKIGNIIFKNKEKFDEILLLSEDRVMTKYSSVEVDSFLLENNEKYISKYLSNTTISQELNFVQLLFKGEFDLLKSDGIFYLEKQDGQILELSQTDIANTSLTNKSNVKNKKYIGIISVLLSDECRNALQKDLQKIQLKDDNLVEFLTKYHLCKETNSQSFTDNRPNFLLNFYGQVGMSYNNFHIEQFGIFPISFEIEKPIVPVFSGGIRLDSFRKYPRLSMDLMLAFSTQKNIVRTFYENNVYAYTGANNYNLNSIEFQWYVNYTFYKSEKIDFYGGVGPKSKFNFFESTVSTWEQRRTTNNATEYFENQFFDMPKTNIGIGLKLGAILVKSSKSRITVEASFNFASNAGQTIIPHTSMLNHTSQTFLIGYSFRKP